MPKPGETWVLAGVGYDVFASRLASELCASSNEIAMARHRNDQRYGEASLSTDDRF